MSFIYFFLIAKDNQASSPFVTPTSSQEEDLAAHKERDRKLKRKKSFKFKQQQQKLSSKSSLHYQSDAEVLIQDQNSPLPPPPEFETKGKDGEVKATESLIIDESELTYLKPLPSPPPIIDINLNIISGDDTGDDEDDSENEPNFFLITDTNQDDVIGENDADIEEDQEKLAKLFAQQQEKLSQKKKEKNKPILTPDPNAKIKYESHKWLLKNINFTRDERIFDVTRMLNEYDKNKMSDLFKDDKDSEVSETAAENDDEDDDEVKIKNDSPLFNQLTTETSSSKKTVLTPLSPTNGTKEKIKPEKFEIDALKQEWSSMFSKLESEYRLKLEEQQLLNDLKLKTLHEEIKKSILEQQELIINKQNQQVI